MEKFLSLYCTACHCDAPAKKIVQRQDNGTIIVAYKATCPKCDRELEEMK